MTTEAPRLPSIRARASGFGQRSDRAYFAVLGVGCVLAVVAVGYLVYKMIVGTTDTWSTFGIWGFVSGREWVPSPANGPPVFGALPFIYGTLATSTIALVIAAPIAVGVALATTTLLPKRLRGPFAAVVDLLAAVPSVVYGIWGLLVLLPVVKPILEWIANHNLGIALLSGPVTSGSSFLVAGMVLAVMIIPIITAVSREVLATVPPDQCEAALALGATRWEMIRGSMLPWSRSGIVGACALGLGRAVGETVAIALLLGNDPRNIFGSLLKPGATLASVIALETPEAGALHLSSLVALGVVMFVVAFVINAVARGIVARAERGPRTRQRRVDQAATAEGTVARVVALPKIPTAVSRTRAIRSKVAETTVFVFLALALVPLALILGTMIVKGVPALTFDFFTGVPPGDPNSTGGGVGNAIVGSGMMMLVYVILAAPLGIAVALFIHETRAAPRPLRRIAKAVAFFVDVLLGIPSIVIGLVVYLGVVLVQGHFSAIAGGIALALIMFPIVVRASDEVLRLVPRAQSEAALALGATRWTTSRSVVLRAATPGLITAVMLGIARAAGETAPLLFTSLGLQSFSWNFNAPVEALPRQIYQDVLTTVTPQTERRAWGASLVLVGAILFLTLTARLIGRRANLTGVR
ncbi:MAG: phosphate ABC transporter permease subunit PstC [Actinobacteria bacterium]|nr:phosphate ABC transporter permease subunit PstC [Actinomycetota bacterium]